MKSLDNHVQLTTALLVVFVFNFQPSAKVILRRGHGLKTQPTAGETGDRILVIPGLQGKWFIQYTMVAPTALLESV